MSERRGAPRRQARQDVTDRNRPPQERGGLVAALEQMSDGVIVQDAGGTISYANAALLAWGGFSLDDLVGQDAATIAVPLLGPENLAALVKAAAAGVPWTSDTDVARPDGSVRHVELTATPVRDSSGTVMSHVILIRDVTRMREMENALAQSERRFREALADVALVAVMLDADGIVTFANRHLLRLTGWEEGEVVGQDWFARLVPPEEQTRGRAAHRAALARGTAPPGWPWRLVTRRGETLAIDWSSAFTRDESGSVIGLVSLGNDVTAREAARAALERSEARLRTALDVMLDGVTLLSAIRDEQGAIADFRVDSANSALGLIGGVAAGQQVGRSLLEMFPAHGTNGLLQAFIRVVETGVPFEADGFRYVDPDAAGGPLDEVLDLRAARLGEGVVMSVRDVTDHHRADREMRRLATAIDQSSDAVMITGAAGAIEYVNPAFQQASGYASEEVLGQNPRILKSGVHGPAFYGAMWAALTSGQSFTSEMTNRRKDGSLFREDAVISPVRDRTGTITSYVAVKRDVTRERASEAAREREARERSLIADTLVGVQAQATPEATSEAILRQVVRLSGIATARLSYFTALDPGIPLAFVRADGVAVPMERAPLQRARTLAERARAGPWIEAWKGNTQHPYDRLFRELGVVAVAHAPIRHGDEVIGLLSVSSSEAGAVQRLTESLPAILEFATLAGAILAPAITGLSEVGDTRARVAQIITTRAFRPVFQPVVDISTRRHVGYEALTRFADGSRPDLAFAQAAAAGLGLELEMATLQAAIAAAVRLPLDAWLSLNVSPDLLLAGGRLSAVLARSARPIVLEVTEHTAIADYAAVRAAIAELGAGIRIAVDDAGSGVANLSHIIELRPAFVKLDLTLVRGLDRDLSRRAMVVGMLHFASEAGCETIAEGVETVEELDVLRSLGVRLAQGYLLGRPAAAES